MFMVKLLCHLNLIPIQYFLAYSMHVLVYLSFMEIERVINTKLN